MEQMKTAEDVTEELKCTCQMEWVQRCNNIHSRTEEIILLESKKFYQKNNSSIWIYGIFKLPHLRKIQTPRKELFHV